MTATQLPTLPGLVEGIVGLAPIKLQCRDCGDIYTGTRLDRPGYDILLSGFRFHICEGRTGVRRCPPCLKAVQDACPKDHYFG